MKGSRQSLKGKKFVIPVSDCTSGGISYSWR